MVSYDRRDLDEFTLPLGRIEEVHGKKDNHTNPAFEPTEKKALEGAHIRLVYVMPDGASMISFSRLHFPAKDPIAVAGIGQHHRQHEAHPPEREGKGFPLGRRLVDGHGGRNSIGK